MNPSAADASRPEPQPLRYRVFLLAASGLVPLALMLLLAAGYLAADRRTDTQQSALELSRALATSVDTELRGTVSLLQSLAVTTEMTELDSNQLAGAGFLPAARRMADSQGWRQIVVADAKGQVLLRTRDVPGSPPPQLMEPESMAQAVSTRRPVVGKLARGPRGLEAFPVRVPVFHGEELRFVLSAVVPSSRVLDVISRQQVAPTWVVGVFDSEGNRIARSRANASTRYSPSLEKLVKGGAREGAGLTRTLEGEENHTGYSRTRIGDWLVAIAIPVSEANADIYRLLAALGAGMIASLGLLAWIAWRAARYITGPIEDLKLAAGHLGAGTPVVLPPLGVRELDDVGAALLKAAHDRDEAAARKDREQAEREELLARVEQALHGAEEANRNKDEFLALLGHELRNPLAPITNALHLMDLKGDPATAREREVIHRQLNYVTRLVDDLLDAARINSKRLVMNMQALQPASVLEQTLDAVRPSLGQRRLHTDIPPGVRAAWSRADEARLVQIFNNLLGNAIKFTRGDGHIAARARADGGFVELAIEDDGVGMAPAELARAFDIFYQVPSGSRGVHGGLGLGLAIVKSLVEMHGGSVTAASDGLGHGTTVVVRLPVVDAPAGTVPAVAAAAPSSALRVLVVDDNEDAALTLATMLEVTGYTAKAVFTPEAAIETFDSFQPRLAVLDIGLPRMDGYELVGRLKAAAGGRRCGFIALTGYGQEADVKKALAAGFDAHLTKPADPDVLLKLLVELSS